MSFSPPPPSQILNREHYTHLGFIEYCYFGFGCFLFGLLLYSYNVVIFNLKADRISEFEFGLLHYVLAFSIVIAVINSDF